MKKENVAKNVLVNIGVWTLVGFLFVITLGLITMGSFTANGLKGKD